VLDRAVLTAAVEALEDRALSVGEQQLVLVEEPFGELVGQLRLGVDRDDENRKAIA